MALMELKQGIQLRSTNLGLITSCNISCMIFRSVISTFLPYPATVMFVYFLFRRSQPVPSDDSGVFHAGALAEMYLEPPSGISALSPAKTHLVLFNQRYRDASLVISPPIPLRTITAGLNTHGSYANESFRSTQKRGR